MAQTPDHKEMCTVRLKVIIIKSRSLSMSHRFHEARALSRVSLALVLGACALAAQAQSSYTLATLRSSNSFAVTPIVLDSQNNALGTAYYYDSFGSLLFGATGIPVFGGSGYIYVTEPSKWAAGTSTSVAPTRLVKGSHQNLLGSSADGSKLVTFSALYETSTGKLINYLPADDGTRVLVHGYQSPRRVDDTGRLALTFDIPSNQVGVMATQYAGVAPGQTMVPSLLPLGKASGAYAFTISPSGVVGGAVVEAATGFDRASVWADAQLTVLDTKPNRGSVVVRINASGQVLACTLSGVSTLMDSVNGPYLQTSYSKLVSVVFANGTEQAIAPLAAGQYANAWALNASGTVVGRSGPLGGSPYQALTPKNCIGTSTTNSRAFIWRNGVTTDLTTFVASKGVKLPAGAVLADALDINDQGSILAVQRASNGTLSYVRLTAKP
jgi:uncharacterized membrane protein